MIAHELEITNELEEFLHTRFNKKIKLINPKKDKKREIVNIALNNCDELLRIENSKNKTSQLFLTDFITFSSCVRNFIYLI